MKKLSLKRLNIVGLNPRILKDAEQIDLIWLMDRKIPIALFEVENTTNITKGIQRMLNMTISMIGGSWILNKAAMSSKLFSRTEMRKNV